MIKNISGRVPSWLNGTLFRNGPAKNDLNGQWFPPWFDGDGMISSFRFQDGNIFYVIRVFIILGAESPRPRIFIHLACPSYF